MGVPGDSAQRAVGADDCERGLPRAVIGGSAVSGKRLEIHDRRRRWGLGCEQFRHAWLGLQATDSALTIPPWQALASARVGAKSVADIPLLRASIQWFCLI